METIGETQTWFVKHIKTSDDPTSASKFNYETVKRQVESLQLPSIAQNPAVLYTTALRHVDLCQRFNSVLTAEELGVTSQSTASVDYRQQCLNLVSRSGWDETRAANGRSRLFLSEREWRGLENRLIALEQIEKKRDNYQGGDGESEYGGDSDAGTSVNGGNSTDYAGSDTESHYGSEVGGDFENVKRKSLRASIHSTGNGSKKNYSADSKLPVVDIELGDLKKDVKKPESADQNIVSNTSKKSAVWKRKNEKKLREEKKPMSRPRCRWVCFTWCVTWWVPSIFLKWCGRMKRSDRQMAWREKVALCIIIFLMNAFILFFIVGLGYILCPKQQVKSPGQISSDPFNKVGSKALVAMYGKYYYANDAVTSHIQNGYANTNEAYWSAEVLGRDISEMFDKTPFWNNYCGIPKPAQYSLFPVDSGFPIKHGTNTQDKSDFIPKIAKFVAGTVVYDAESINNRLAASANSRIIVAYDKVYDISSFFQGQYTDVFLGPVTKLLFQNYGVHGEDTTTQWEYMRKNYPVEWQNVMTCMNNLYYIGNVDHRQDARCIAPDIILLVASCLLVLIIGFKFVAALQLGGKHVPEDHDKFVICQVPCYTEVLLQYIFYVLFV